MLDNPLKWLPLDQAAKYFGYSHPESLRQRLRELRKRGNILDIGKPPSKYKVGRGESKDKIILFWVNPKTTLISIDAPRNLLIPKRGKRSLTFK